jgi:hypothetical protein
MNSNHTKTQPVKQNPKYSLSQGDFVTFINWIQVGHGLTCKTYESSVHPPPGVGNKMCLLFLFLFHQRNTKYLKFQLFKGMCVFNFITKRHNKYKQKLSRSKILT